MSSSMEQNVQQAQARLARTFERALRLALELATDHKLHAVHSSDACAGRTCCIHNPSDHHMRHWPMVWRADRGLMERTCEHGIGHPDPDHMAYVLTMPGRVGEYESGVHGCCHDLCCIPR